MRAAHHVRQGVRRTEPRYAASLTALMRDVRPGCEIIAVTGGEWSLADLVFALAEQDAPADIDITSWTVGRQTIETMAALMGRHIVGRVRWLVDRGFPARQPSYATRMARLFPLDCIRAVRVHAKWIVISGRRTRYAIRTSCNLNVNPRMEIVEISGDPALAAFLSEVMDGYWREVPAGFPDHAMMTAGQRAAEGGMAADADPADALADAEAWIARQMDLI